MLRNLHEAFAWWKDMLKKSINSIAKGSITPEQLEQRLALAEQYSNKANEIRPGIAAYTNLAHICLARKNYACALENHKKIIDISDDKLIANQNVGSMLILWAKKNRIKIIMSNSHWIFFTRLLNSNRMTLKSGSASGSINSDWATLQRHKLP
jgi:tetratricopeptide (TPR) repeat protein